MADRGKEGTSQRVVVDPSGRGDDLTARELDADRKRNCVIAGSPREFGDERYAETLRDEASNGLEAIATKGYVRLETRFRRERDQAPARRGVFPVRDPSLVAQLVPIDLLLTRPPVDRADDQVD